MKLSTKRIRIIFLVVFLLVSIGALLSGIYWIWLTAFGVGWGGGEVGLIELLWTWKGIIALFFFATTAFIGLIKPWKVGVIFGYSIPIAMSIYVGISMINSTTYDLKNNKTVDFSDIIGLLIGIIFIIGILTFSITGLNKIKTDYFKFKAIDYGITVGLVVTLLLSWLFVFKI
ncbi:MAG: hypothetical protein AB3N18_09710 [Allomuricauda sp.]